MDILKRLFPVRNLASMTIRQYAHLYVIVLGSLVHRQGCSIHSIMSSMTVV